MSAARRIRAVHQLLRWEVGLDPLSVRCARLLHARLRRQGIGTLQLMRLLGVSMFRGLRLRHTLAPWTLVEISRLDAAYQGDGWGLLTEVFA